MNTSREQSAKSRSTLAIHSTPVELHGEGQGHGD